MTNKTALLTPPSTGHRVKDKENREIDPSSRVVFAKDDEIHILQPLTLKGSVTPTTPSKTSLKRKASKSILKKSSAFRSIPCPPESPQREVTPEPNDPLCDLAYLAYPVTRIIQPDNSLIDASNNRLKEVIEAYCILTARLRAALAGKSDLGDESWPLFQPLRKNKHAFSEAVVRDLERATAEITPAVEEESERTKQVLLPSPRNTPQKKKRKDGLNEDQIKYARDMCTTAHAVMRFLGVAFTTPAIFQIFSDKQIRSMFTAVLAIPLAPELPSLNARKTCALAIGLIQTQRLPIAILAPAADRISYALTRGIDGELGKEGKKGSAADGLKAIHDLALHLPSLFVPAFGKAPHVLLTSVFSNLLAPTLTLRIQACHAIGGYAFACATLRDSSKHKQVLRDISELVKELLMTPSPYPSSPQKSGNDSPSKSDATSAIYRTLRTTLQAVEPQHPAHGPVWALSVLGALIVLLGDELKRDAKLTRVLGAMMGLAMRHKKSAVRGLACVVWRAFIWIYIGEDTLDDEEEEGEETRAECVKAKQALWNLISSVTEIETGICTVAGLLNPALDVYPEEEDNTDTLRRRQDGLHKSMEVLDAMTTRDTTTCGQAFDLMKVLANVTPGSPKWDRFRDALRNPAYVIINDKDTGRPTLLPQGLFSAYPGLLTAEWKGMANNVNIVYEEMWKADDVRRLDTVDFSLGCSEADEDGVLGAWKGLWVWEGMLKPWKYILGSKAMWESNEVENESEWKTGMWKELVGIWGNLIGLCIASLRDADDLSDDVLVAFVERAADVIIETVLQNQDLDLTVARTGKQAISKKMLAKPAEPTALVSMRLDLAMDLWATMRDVMSADTLKLAGVRLLSALMNNVDDFVTFPTSEESVVSAAINSSVEQWVYFCIDILSVCGVGELKEFWGFKNLEGEIPWRWKWDAEQRRCVWAIFGKRWIDVVGESEFESAIALLALPFLSDNAFDLTKDDVVVWQALLEHAVAKALDDGSDAPEVLSQLASLVSAANQASAPGCVYLAEMLLTFASEFDIQLPGAVLELVNETMRVAYPPSVAEKVRYSWLVRAVAKILGDYSGEGLKAVVGGLSGGIAVCLQDESSAWSQDELEYDIVPLYEVLLVGLRSLPASLDNLAIIGPVVASPLSGREAIQLATTSTFQEFWDATYSTVSPPTDGWPEDVKVALRVVYGLGDCTDEPEVASPSAEAVDLSPEVPIMFRPSTPTTPTRDLPSSSPSTPTRTRKPQVSLFSQLPPSSPFSPMTSRTPHTPRRTPYYTPGRDSPSKRRRVDRDKENMSPASKYVFRPIVERIAMQSPCQKSSTLGKRRACDEPAMERPSPLKKGKRPFDEVTEDSEDERELVVTQLSALPGLFSDAALPPQPTSPLKRKRSVFDAVELPYLRDILPGQGRLRTSVSFDTHRYPQTPVHDRILKLSNSTSKAHAFAKKRADSDDVFCGPPSDDSLSSDPFELQAPNKSLQLSSDDDPHLGQVTPHGLASPALQKGRGRMYDDCDLSSDEPSPTKDVVQRKLKRMSSFTALDNITPKLGKVTSWT